MSAQPVSFAQHPPHGHPDNQAPSTQKDDKPSTASHPPPTKPDPTTATATTSTVAPHPKLNSQAAAATTTTTNGHHAQGRLASAAAAGPAQLSDLEMRLRRAIRTQPDFPQPGILFQDVLPIFASPTLHADLITALELLVQTNFARRPDVVVALESRGFLFGPSLAVRLGAGFVPVRKKGKLPGEVETEAFEKEYGQDVFQIQRGAISPGQKVLVVDDLVATGGSAACAGNLVEKLGGELLGFVFLMELTVMNGRERLAKPVYTLLAGHETGGEEDGEKEEKKKEQGVDGELPLGRTRETADEVREVKDAGGAAAETRP